MQIHFAAAALLGAFLLAGHAAHSQEERDHPATPAESASPETRPEVTVPPGHTPAPLEGVEIEPEISPRSGEPSVVGPEEVPAPGADAPVRTAEEGPQATLARCQEALSRAHQRLDAAEGEEARQAEDLLDRAEGHLEAGDGARCIELVQRAVDIMS